MSMSVLIVAVIALAWLTAGSTAVRSVSRIWLRHWAERRLRGSSAAALYLERPQRLLATAATGAAFVIAIAGMAVGGWRQETVPQRAAWLLAAAGVLLVGGRIIPRALARRWAAPLVPALLPGLRVLELALSPLHALARQAARPFQPPPPAVSLAERDGLEDLLREGELEGVGEREESAIISGIVEFGAKSLGDVMTPRSEIFALDASLRPDDLASRIAQSGFSRVPLYRGVLDDVVGMVHVFDVLKAADAAPRVRPVADALASRACSEQLFDMLRQRRHLAIVREDAAGRGRVVGLVTLEDLLEELVGDISDEHDEPLPAGRTAPALSPFDHG